MRITVEDYIGDRGMKMPARLRFGRRRVAVIETIDQWHGADHRYVKIKGADGCLYILRYDKLREDWELTMFQSVRGQAPEMAVGTQRAARHAGRRC
jgi:hypothetical protein